MSVVLSKRKLSGIEYVDNARKLFIFSLQRCGRFPKRYTFTLSTKITDLAREVYLNVDDAYRVRPDSKSNIRTRCGFFKHALGCLNEMVVLISVAEETFPINPEIIKQWMVFIDKEERLINGVRESDRRRDVKEQ